MSQFSVTKSRLHAGIWEGVITTTGDPDVAPDIQVTHLQRPVLSMAITQDASQKDVWQLRIAIPPELLSDGVQVFLISDTETGEKLESFTIITGEPLEDDVRSEVALQREELDMLKRAFRRHCLETR